MRVSDLFEKGPKPISPEQAFSGAEGPQVALDCSKTCGVPTAMPFLAYLKPKNLTSRQPVTWTPSLSRAISWNVVHCRRPGHTPIAGTRKDNQATKISGCEVGRQSARQHHRMATASSKRGQRRT